MLEIFVEAENGMKMVYMAFFLWTVWLVFDGITKIIKAVSGTPDSVHLEIKKDEKSNDNRES